MTPALRKAAERQRRAARGEVALSGWLSASDHAALTQMARDSGMTQAQVVSRLIGIPDRVRALCNGTGEHLSTNIRHSDLTAAVGLLK